MRFSLVFLLLGIHSMSLSHADESGLVASYFEDMAPSAPGCAVGVMNGDGALYRQGFGLANIEHQAPITSSTRFNIASNTKQFTVLAVALLAEDGVLSLDDPLAQFFPEFEKLGDIRIRHLIHHTSGLRSMWALLYARGPINYASLAPQDILWLLKRQEGLNFEPGETWDYSNTGYLLLSQIVEQTTGKTLGQFARERIFEPLGMKDTFYREDRNAITPGRAYGYDWNEEAGEWRADEHIYRIMGAGGMQTSVDDLIRYHKDVVRGEKVWSKTVRDIMLSPARLADGAPALDGASFGGEPYDGYAGGLLLSHSGTTDIVSHGGANPGFRSRYVYLPETGIGVAVLCNAGGKSRHKKALDIARLYIEDAAMADTPDGTARPKTPSEVTDLGESQPVSDEQAAVLAGRYYSEELAVTYDFFHKDGQLLLHIPETITTYGLPDTGFVFKAYKDGTVISNGFLTLLLDGGEAGSVEGFILDLPRARGIRFFRTD